MIGLCSLNYIRIFRKRVCNPFKFKLLFTHHIISVPDCCMYDFYHSSIKQAHVIPLKNMKTNARSFSAARAVTKYAARKSSPGKLARRRQSARILELFHSRRSRGKFRELAGSVTRAPRRLSLYARPCSANLLSRARLINARSAPGSGNLPQRRVELPRARSKKTSSPRRPEQCRAFSPGARCPRGKERAPQRDFGNNAARRLIKISF